MVLQQKNGRIFSVCNRGYDNVMRNKMEAILKETLRDLCLKTRYDRGLTQNKMSEALLMSERSYEEIECGRSACGALTAVLLLIESERSPQAIENLRKSFTEAYESEVVTL